MRKFLLLGMIAKITFAFSSMAVACVTLENSLPELEEIKITFEAGNFEKSMNEIARLSNPPQEVEEFSESLREKYPNGFDFCETVLSEERSSKFREELVLFGAYERDLIFLLLRAVNFNDQWVVVDYHISTSFAEISAKLD